MQPEAHVPAHVPQAPSLNSHLLAPNHVRLILNLNFKTDQSPNKAQALSPKALKSTEAET